MQYIMIHFIQIMHNSALEQNIQISDMLLVEREMGKK